MPDYYNHAGYPAQGAAGSSSAMRAELDAIAAAFNKLPILSGNPLKIIRVNSSGTALEAVTAGSADISAGDVSVTPSGGISSLNVQAALVELDTDISSKQEAATAVSKTASTGSAVMPAGTTAQRDATPSVGYTRFNTTLNADETWNGSVWLSAGNVTQTGTETLSNKTLDATCSLAGNAATATNGVPVGTVIDYAGASLPSGYLDCDGAAVNRTTYAALFTAIGIVWGAGDGSTTFNLPSFPTGYASVAGVVGNTVTGDVKSHFHSVNVYASSTGGSNDRITAGNTGSGSSNSTLSTGGSANLAAGVNMRKVIKT